MGTDVQICPCCGNYVQAKKIKSYSNKVARQGTKTAVHSITSASGAASGAAIGTCICPGIGTVIGGAVGFIGSAMFNQAVNSGIDSVADEFTDFELEFTCPKCGHTWKNSSPDTSPTKLDLFFEAMDEDEQHFTEGLFQIISKYRQAFGNSSEDAEIENLRRMYSINEITAKKILLNTIQAIINNDASDSEPPQDIQAFMCNLTESEEKFMENLFGFTDNLLSNVIKKLDVAASEFGISNYRANQIVTQLLNLLVASHIDSSSK